MYPTLQRRYLSSLIDGLLLLFVMVVGTIAYQGDNQTIRLARFVVMMLIFVSYEPILTSRLCTVGHAAIGIRVRRHSDRSRKISLARAYLRTVLKIALGMYSFFAMGFNQQRRAVHDFGAGSVVIEATEAKHAKLARTLAPILLALAFPLLWPSASQASQRPFTPQRELRGISGLHLDVSGLPEPIGEAEVSETSIRDAIRELIENAGLRLAGPTDEVDAPTLRVTCWPHATRHCTRK